MKTAPSILLTLITAVATSLFAQQPGDLDSTFGVNGIVITPTAIVYGREFAFQTDGKFLVAGQSNSDLGVARYHHDGTIDSSFGVAGIAAIDYANESQRARGMVLQADGKIVAAGRTTVGPDNFFLARFNSDGSADNDFATYGRVRTFMGCSNAEIFDIALLPGGKIIAGGYSCGDFAIAQYKANGTQDSTFSSDGEEKKEIVNGYDVIFSILPRADGKIVMTGASLFHGDPFLVRYKPDGVIDSTFGTNGIATAAIQVSSAFVNPIAAILQPDGKIIMGAGDGDFVLIRFNENGSLDSSFGTGGIVTTEIGGTDDRINALALQPDGKIVATGQSEMNSAYYAFAILRYNADGTLDSTFSSDGKHTLRITTPSGNDNYFYSVVIQQDGKILATGTACNACEIATSTIPRQYVLARFISGLNMGVNIEGAITTETGLPVSEVTVTLSGDDAQTDITDTNGRYSFSVEHGGSYSITPSKSNDSIPNNGITAFDVLLMRRHILGNGLLASPYKIIAAAEVNADGDTTITTQDILFTRSLILGNISSFPTNRLWQFVSSDYVFPDTQHPFPFDKTRTYTNITANQTNQNFIGIKLGDVNGSWDPNVH